MNIDINKNTNRNINISININMETCVVKKKKKLVPFGGCVKNGILKNLKTEKKMQIYSENEAKCKILQL